MRTILGLLTVLLLGSACGSQADHVSAGADSEDGWKAIGTPVLTALADLGAGSIGVFDGAAPVDGQRAPMLWAIGEDGKATEHPIGSEPLADVSLFTTSDGLLLLGVECPKIDSRPDYSAESLEDLCGGTVGAGVAYKYSSSTGDWRRLTDALPKGRTGGLAAVGLDDWAMISAYDDGVESFYSFDYESAELAKIGSASDGFVSGDRCATPNGALLVRRQDPAAADNSSVYTVPVGNDPAVSPGLNPDLKAMVVTRDGVSIEQPPAAPKELSLGEPEGCLKGTGLIFRTKGGGDLESLGVDSSKRLQWSALPAPSSNTNGRPPISFNSYASTLAAWQYHTDGPRYSGFVLDGGRWSSVGDFDTPEAPKRLLLVGDRTVYQNVSSEGSAVAIR